MPAAMHTQVVRVVFHMWNVDRSEWLITYIGEVPLTFTKSGQHPSGSYGQLMKTANAQLHNPYFRFSVTPLDPTTGNQHVDGEQPE